MGYGVYKQPDGLYAIWSTMVNDFIWYDCTRGKVAQFWRGEFGQSGEYSLEWQLAYADNGGRPDGQTFARRLQERNDASTPEEGEESDYVAWLAKWSVLDTLGVDA